MRVVPRPPVLRRAQCLGADSQSEHVNKLAWLIESLCNRLRHYAADAHARRADAGLASGHVMPRPHAEAHDPYTTGSNAQSPGIGILPFRQ